MRDAAIAVHGLTKTFGGRLAVDGLTFEVPRGRVTGFLGPNGAGKTTTMRMILGLARPTSGTATVFGARYADLPRPARSVGALLDAGSFHPRRTARDHLRWVAAAAEIDRTRIDAALEDVDLARHAVRHVGEFSLGMRQRLGLAVALLADPELLILDEPANGLDPAGIRWLRALLRRFASEGGAVFVSSHLLAEVAQLADDVIVIDRGRLVAHTDVRELTTGGTPTARVRTPDDQRLTTILQSRGTTVQEVDGALEVRGLAPQAVGEAAAGAGIVLHELTTGAHTLEEVFFELVGRQEDNDGPVAQG